MRKITKLTRAKRNLIVEEVSKSYSNYKKYQNLATKYAIVNDRTKVFTSYNKIQQEIKKLLTELNGNYKVIVGNRKVELIMMDEPSLGLAPLLVEEVIEIIREINKEGKTVLLVEQNAFSALKVADYAYVLEVGAITLQGAGKELLSDKRVIDAYLGG